MLPTQILLQRVGNIGSVYADCVYADNTDYVYADNTDVLGFFATSADSNHKSLHKVLHDKARFKHFLLCTCYDGD